MRYWTDDDKQRVRYGIAKLAEDELNKKELNQWQLQAIFLILAFNAKVDYKQEESERDNIAGWFIEDHF